MVEEVQVQQPTPAADENISDEEAIMRIAQAMKDSSTAQEDKQNVHTFLINVIQTEDVDKAIKVGNLRDDKEVNELGLPQWNIRGALGMARISNMIMGNEFFSDYFNSQVKETVGSSLSRDGFVIRQATTQNKNVADVTRRRKVNKGMFGKKNIEESGGDPYSNSGSMDN
jgi:hypothetical protein